MAPPQNVPHLNLYYVAIDVVGRDFGPYIFLFYNYLDDTA